MAATLIFKHNRLCVGRSLGDFQLVWYEPVEGSEAMKRPCDKIGLYWRSQGDVEGRSPLSKAIAWGELWNPEHLHCKDKPTRDYLHEQLLRDVWNYLTNREPEREREFEANLIGRGTSGLHFAVMQAATAVRNQKIKERATRKKRRAREQGKRPEEVDSDSSDDSGFGSGYDDAGTGSDLDVGPGDYRGRTKESYDDKDTNPWPSLGTRSSTGLSRGSMGPPPRMNNQNGKTAATGQRRSSSTPSSIQSQGRKRTASEMTRDYESHAIGSSSPPTPFRREGRLGGVRDSVESHAKSSATNRCWMAGSVAGLRIHQETEDEANERRFRKDTKEAIERSKKEEIARRTLGGQLPRQNVIIDLDGEDEDEDGGDEVEQEDKKLQPSDARQHTSPPDRPTLLKPFVTPGPSQPQLSDVNAFLRAAEEAREESRRRMNLRSVNGDIEDENDALRKAKCASLAPESMPQASTSPKDLSRGRTQAMSASRAASSVEDSEQRPDAK